MHYNRVANQSEWIRGLEGAAHLLDYAIADLEAGVSTEPNDTEKVLRRFHKAARYLARERRTGKAPFVIEDEYDVQDLMYTILKSIYPDAERESPTLKKASGSKKIDIVLPQRREVVEIKFWHKGKAQKDLIGELQIDIETYHEHPSCGHLFCFIYDPNECCNDDEGVESELSGHRVKGEHKSNVTGIVCGR